MHTSPVSDPHPLERPLLLTLGLVLQALSAVLATFLYSLGGLVAAGVLGISLAEVAFLQVWPLSQLAGLGALAFGFAAGFHIFLLYTCWRAWEGERTWLWALIAASLCGLASTGLVSMAAGLVTVLGAWQQLELLDRRA